MREVSTGAHTMTCVSPVLLPEPCVPVYPAHGSLSGLESAKTLSAGLVRISGVGDDASISAVRAFPLDPVAPNGAVRHAIDPQMKRPRKLVLGRRAMDDMHIDADVGMFYSELIMFCIIVAAAATIYKAGAKDVSQLDLAAIAEVLRPLAGDAASFLFTLGIPGIGPRRCRCWLGDAASRAI